MPKVSIVLPSYNGEQYLFESIDSILRQTFSDWELIIVDDCSKDSTFRIAEEYVEKDPRIQVIHNTVNQKLPESLNIGFRHSKGEYLTWTSDDNMYLSNAVEKMVQYLDAHDEKPMVCANMLIMDENMRYLREADGYDEAIMCMDDVVGAAFMYRREVLKDVGEYSKEFFCVEDYEYWIRILQRYGPGSIGYLDSIVYLYRSQPNSLTATKADRIQLMRGLLRLKYLDWIVAGIGNNEMLIMELYNDLLVDESAFNCFKENAEKIIPELAGERPLEKNIPIILFGTGNMGRKAYELISDRVIAFVDSAQSKFGEKIYGLPILSPYVIKDLGEKVQVVVSASYKYQLEMMRCLINLGIARYTICSRIIWEKLR